MVAEKFLLDYNLFSPDDYKKNGKIIYKYYKDKHGTVCSCHVTYAFESESTLYSCLNTQPLGQFGQMVECLFKN